MGWECGRDGGAAGEEAAPEGSVLGEVGGGARAVGRLKFPHRRVFGRYRCGDRRLSVRIGDGRTRERPGSMVMRGRRRTNGALLVGRAETSNLQWPAYSFVCRLMRRTRGQTRSAMFKATATAARAGGLGLRTPLQDGAKTLLEIQLHYFGTFAGEVRRGWSELFRRGRGDSSATVSVLCFLVLGLTGGMAGAARWPGSAGCIEANMSRSSSSCTISRLSPAR